MISLADERLYEAKRGGRNQTVSGSNREAWGRSRQMTDTRLLQECEVLAEKLGVRVTREDLAGRPGGLCTLKGERRMILNKRLDVTSQIEIFCRAFARLPIDEIYVVPQLRDRIDACR